jgi:hypothetical protein
MTDNSQPTATQIAFNFGPIRGDVLEQHIHPVQPTPSSEPQTAAEPETSQESAQEQEAAPKQLSRSQAVILFSALLGEPLEQGFGQHKTQLAGLISRVTGYTPGGVRQKIMEIGKMDVYPLTIQQDAEMVAKLIEPYNSQIASDIRITYLDE